MSNPRNRRQTRGAFGKPKTASEKALFRNIPGNLPLRSSGPEGFNISDAIVDFAKPITEQAGNNHTALRGALNVAILLWNAIIEGEVAVDTAKKKLLGLPGASAEQVDELVATMTARKQELYPEARQLVCDFTLSFTKKGANIRVASVNLAPKGVEKTDLAAQLAAASPPPATQV